MKEIVIQKPLLDHKQVFKLNLEPRFKLGTIPKLTTIKIQQPKVVPLLKTTTITKFDPYSIPRITGKHRPTFSLKTKRGGKPFWEWEYAETINPFSLELIPKRLRGLGI